MRTSFTEEQVKVLQQHFAIDSNPDGQDLERIAKLTGLKKRVTQVGTELTSSSVSSLSPLSAAALY